MFRTMATACAVLGLWTVSAAAQVAEVPKQVEVKFTFKPGEVTRHRVVTKTVGSMAMVRPLGEQKFAQTFEEEIAFTCVKVNPDGSAQYEVSMPRVAMDMSFGGMRMSWSSDDADKGEKKTGWEAIPAAIFKAMTEIRYTLVMDSDGKPIKLEGLSEGFKKLMAKFDEGELQAPLKAVFEKFGDWMSDDQMMEHMEWGYRMMPPGKVIRVGDTWEHKWSQAIPFVQKTMQVEGKYEVVAFEPLRGHMCAKVRTLQKMSTVKDDAAKEEAKDKANPLANLDCDMEMEESEGFAYFDVKTWDVVEMRQIQNMTIRIGMAPDPDAEDPQLKTGIPTMTQKFKTSVKLDLVEGEGVAAGKASTSAPAGTAASTGR